MSAATAGRFLVSASYVLTNTLPPCLPSLRQLRDERVGKARQAHLDREERTRINYTVDVAATVERARKLRVV